MKAPLAGPVAALLLLAAPAWASAQDDLARVLSFDAPGLGGWLGVPDETLSQDSLIVHGGSRSGRIDVRTAGGSALTAWIPRDFAGRSIQLRGWLRTRDVEGFAGLWLRQDGRTGSVQFDNMSDRRLEGTTDWTQYSVTLPLDGRAQRIYFGAQLSGQGTVWVDDLELLVDDVPVQEAPPFEKTPPPAELDTEFGAGSPIGARELTADQVDRLALLGRVWGFVKYHHPTVSTGGVNWDYELFRVVPSVLNAPERAEAVAAMASWLAELGDPAPCDPCAMPTGDPHLLPDIDWIRNRELLGSDLSATLQLIHSRRFWDGEPYYVDLVPNVRNPDFSNEASYPAVTPDAGFRLLALYRFWNIIEYWFPYRDLIEGGWEGVLVEFLPRAMREATVEEYPLLMQELSVRVGDTHANVGAALALRPPRGPAELPVIVRFVEGRAVVTGFKHAELGPASGLRVGDVIEQLDGRPVEELLRAWAPYYSASNEPARLSGMARTLTRGPQGAVSVSGDRADGSFEVRATRVASSGLDPLAGRWHDLPGEAFQMLADDVAYLKLSSVVAADVTSYVQRAAQVDVFVVDIRNYPSEYLPFVLGGHFVNEPTPFASFTRADPANPGAFRWEAPIGLRPLQPFFRGQLLILVDEVSISQAEFTAMALRAGRRAIVAGSTTAGADGDVSPIPLPGGIRSLISGIGVFYSNRTATQQVGIVPDLEIRPTIDGIRAGRDEVLEEAVSAVLGREFRLERSLGR